MIEGFRDPGFGCQSNRLITVICLYQTCLDHPVHFCLPMSGFQCFEYCLYRPCIQIQLMYLLIFVQTALCMVIRLELGFSFYYHHQSSQRGSGQSGSWTDTASTNLRFLCTSRNTPRRTIRTWPPAINRSCPPQNVEAGAPRPSIAVPVVPIRVKS